VTAQITVAGVPLHAHGALSGVEWSSCWLYDGVGGDKQASWQWFTTIRPPWLHAGADVVIRTSGRRRWAGRLNEPEETDGGWSCSAYGLRVLADDYQSFVNVAAPGDPDEWATSTSADPALDSAIDERNLPWFRFDDFGSSPVGTEDDTTLTLGEVLARATKRAGLRAVVDQFGTARLLADPTAARWRVGGMSNYLGTADDELVTRLYGYYVSGVDGSTGEPNGWATVVTPELLSASTETADERKFGVRVERTVNLTALGLVTEADAQADVDGRFALVGGRMGWTAGFAVTRAWLTAANGAPGNPAAIRAGDMLALPGVRDFRTSTANRATAIVIAGEARYVADEDVCYVTPMGYVPRDFQSALTAAQKPEKVEAA
jgi:hypothetical protein